MKITTENLILEPTHESELSYVLETENDEKYRNHVNQWSIRDHMHVVNSDKDYHFIVKSKETGEKIGYMIFLRDMGSCGIQLQRIIITKQGFGYGKEAFEAAMNRFSTFPNIFFMYLYVKEVNRDHLITYYEKLGFKKTDLVNMQMPGHTPMMKKA